MDRIDQASILTRANVYFDGRCISHTVIGADGSRKSVGVILPASLRFTTAAAERMQLVDGRCRVRLDGETAFREYGAGEEFRVPGQSAFDIEALAPVHYICHFEA